MSRRRKSWMVLLVCIAALGSGEVSAQAHGRESRRQEKVIDPAVVEAARAAKLAELEAWLKRLVGKFRYEGDIAEVIATFGTPRNLHQEVSRSHARGIGDCVGFGDGPGVQCVINVTWPPTWRYDPAQLSGMGLVGTPSIPGFAQYLILSPAMSLYGIDPDSLGIRYMQVNGKSVAEVGLGVLKDDVVTLETPTRFGNEGYVFARQTIRITAKPDLRVIRIDISVAADKTAPPSLSFHFVLHRILEGAAEGASRVQH